VKFVRLVLKLLLTLFSWPRGARNGLSLFLLPLALLFVKPKYSDSSLLWYENHHFALGASAGEIVIDRFF